MISGLCFSLKHITYFRQSKPRKIELVILEIQFYMRGESKYLLSESLRILENVPNYLCTYIIFWILHNRATGLCQRDKNKVTVIVGSDMKGPKLDSMFLVYFPTCSYRKYHIGILVPTVILQNY